MSAPVSRPTTAVDEKTSLTPSDSMSRPQTATNDPALGGAAPILDEKAQAQAAAAATVGAAQKASGRKWFGKRKSEPESADVGKAEDGIASPAPVEEIQKQVSFTELFR